MLRELIQMCLAEVNKLIRQGLEIVAITTSTVSTADLVIPAVKSWLHLASFMKIFLAKLQNPYQSWQEL